MFICTQRTAPAKPNGISIDFIDVNVANVTYDDNANNTFVNYTVTMEIVPVTCDHMIPTMTVQIDADTDGSHGYVVLVMMLVHVCCPCSSHTSD